MTTLANTLGLAGKMYQKPLCALYYCYLIIIYCYLIIIYCYLVIVGRRQSKP